ncbi:hypothetical protein LMG19083_02462 [Ralstonia psammae]|uniref:Lipoprotein n=1 Tax=Ralstonia psammae TaxID=3058598 RepID=A0ABN9IY06_9RALS|nr:hypothetical protein [Ralstonia sp. LMG 19083]CAJ0793629.1 hypothetical protein LMG19083_02462 [Ralstonia sp. LMG 19083]
MHRFLFLTLLLISAACSATPPTSTHVGYFSNQKTTATTGDPHSEGYAVDLYREGSHVFGKFYVSTGIEAPSGPIYNAKIDLSAHTVTFGAKLSTGFEFTRDSGPQGRPARDVFEFHGKISRSTLEGRLIHKSGYDPTSDIRSEHVLLRRVNINMPSVDYAEWLKESANAPVDW